MVVPKCFLNYGGSNVVMQRDRQNPSKVLSSWCLSFRKRETEPIKDFAIIKLVIQRERIHQGSGHHAKEPYTHGYQVRWSWRTVVTNHWDATLTMRRTLPLYVLRETSFPSMSCYTNTTTQLCHKEFNALTKLLINYLVISRSWIIWFCKSEFGSSRIRSPKP
jgi:hypothetical protein